jgi:hypothetical protein
MLKRHTGETASATLILLVCGGALVYLSHRWGAGSGLMPRMAAAVGPVALVLGIGAAVHGRSMPPTHITPLARIWGTVGAFAAGLNLWSLGYFARGHAGWLLPVLLVAAWWLPARLYGPVPPPPRSDESASLGALLDALEQIGEAHPEFYDTDVRERIWNVVERRYVRLEHDYAIPEDLGLYSEDGNRELRAALEHHLRTLAVEAEARGLGTQAARLGALQDPAVTSRQQGLTYDALLGAP